MAKLCVLCGGLCAYFLLFFTITAVSTSNDYYFYDVEGEQNSDRLIALETLEHRLQKRDVENNQSNTPETRSNNTTASAKPNETIGAQNQSSNGSEIPSKVNKSTIDTKISTKTKSGKTTKVAPMTIITQVPLHDKNSTFPYANETVQKTNNSTNIKPSVVETNHPTNPPLNQSTTTEEIPSDLPEDDEGPEFNKTLVEHNITTTREDNHMYYNSTVRTDPQAGRFYWVDLSNHSDTKINWLLSKSHRRAATVQLSFEFPFYGHIIKNVTIATGGFLYTGDYVHSWLAATQYIAPLMANFDTRLSNESFIRYADNGTAFTVEWEKVSLQDKPNEGEFTFQTTLYKNGDIVFVYQNVPLFIKHIEDNHHPVKVGLSDAYIIHRNIFLVRRKTIYEYHRINFLKEEIQNWTVIYLKALPTCLEHGGCTACVSSNAAYFKCLWCPGTHRCSSGVDRHRHDWLAKGCEKKSVDEASMCAHISGADIFDDSNITYTHDATEFQHQLEGSTHPVKMGVSSIVAILFLIAMVAGLAVWILYAYRNPHTTSGQILIRYRPSQWRWRRGEARYTAATIHM